MRMVCIVEGEKDADNLWALGIPAPCNPGGAGKWRTEFDTLFAGKIVVMLPDNDEAGRRHAEDIVCHLLAVASLVKVVMLRGLPEKGDVSDWINAGGTRNQLIDLIQEAPPEDSAASLVRRKEPAPPPAGRNWPRKLYMDSPAISSARLILSPKPIRSQF